MDIYLNTTATDSSLLAAPANFVLMDIDVDYLILLTNGSVSVADGQPIPSTTQLNQAGIVLTGIEQTCSKYFLADDSANLLKQIHNMGAGNKRYVLAFDFTESETASEPVLEAWDDVTMDSIASVVLGETTPSASWIRGITTTDALPGAAWVGSRLAGDSAGNFLLLNNGNGALVAPKTLYAQLKVVVPSTEVNGGAENPILVCKYTIV
jgi:hypothetical protein